MLACPAAGHAPDYPDMVPPRPANEQARPPAGTSRRNVRLAGWDDAGITDERGPAYLRDLRSRSRSAERSHDLLETIHGRLHAGLHPVADGRLQVVLVHVLHEKRQGRVAVLLVEHGRVHRPAAGMPSYISVKTMRSSGTISRYSPWKTTSDPPLLIGFFLPGDSLLFTAGLLCTATSA